MNILLIGQNEAHTSQIAQALHAFGYQVTVCPQGEAVLRACAQTFYPLVILDLLTFKNNSVELCRELCSLPLRKHQFILALTEREPSREMLAAWGIDDHLTAPIRIEQLKLRVTALERQWGRLNELAVKSTYLMGMLRALRETKRLLGKDNAPHLVLQQICEILTDTQGIVSVQVKLIDESGILVKIAESVTPLNRARATPGNQMSTWLEYAGACYGVMSAVFSNALALSEEEQHFVHEVAAEIASALYHIDLELKRRRTEHALRDTEARYQELGDSITDLFFALDTHLVCRYWNKTAENLTGIPAKTSVGSPLLSLFPDLHGTEAERGYVEAIQTHTPRNFVQTTQLKGKLFYFEVNIYPIREEFSVFAKDITFRKQMEDALKKSWDYLEKLNNSLGDAIFTVKMPEHAIDYVNHAVESIFGYTIDECIGQETRFFFSETAGYQTFVTSLEDAMRQQSDILRKEHQLRRKNGEDFTAEITTTFLRDETDAAHITGIISVVRDITDRKQMEFALEQERASLTRKVEERTVELRRMNAELARASQLKDEFLANVSHDLRTPLNAILGYAKILRKTEPLSPLQNEGLDIIQSSGEHLLHLINDILDLSKIETGHLELHPTPFNFREFLQQMVKMIRVRAGHKDVAFIEEYAPDLPVGVSADGNRLREALINLLDNAVKFTEHGQVLFTVNRRATRIRFEIDDTGTGMTDDQLNQIFLPFYQGKNADAQEGTGLGLTISQQLVKLMGGELHVKSMMGKGSTFWFEVDLPEVPEHALKPQPQQPEIIGYTGSQRTILVVDDKPANRALLVDLLLPLGFEVLQAANGEECVALTRQERPDIILLDLLMPGIDGFEAARQIRRSEGRWQMADGRREEEQKGRRAEGKKSGRKEEEINLQSAINNQKSKIPIIAISASVFEETRRKSLAAGCDAFLSKPIENDQLFACLQTHLGVEWVYASEFHEESAPEKRSFPEELFAIQLPPEEVRALGQWADCGNITRLLETLSRIEQVDPQYAPVVMELRRCVRNFQLQHVLEYVARSGEHV